MRVKYFNSLNYTLANEDTALELAILPKKSGHVLSVAGSGGRVLPLLARAPGKITCADISPYQLFLTELRFETLRHLDRSEFMAFWGYPPRDALPKERREIFESLKLSAPARKFLREFMAERDWGSILYEGKWEKTFRTLSRVNRRFVGIRGLALFDCLSFEEQSQYLEREFPRRTWELALRTMGNASIFNALLYKGSFPKKNMEESFFEFYRECFQRLFLQGMVRENFFLQLLFFGKVIFTEGCPVECDPKVYVEAKRAIGNTEIVYREGDILETARKTRDKIDFFSFSDVPSYFSGSMERGFMHIIRESLNPEALVVVRNYLRVPENLNLKGFENVTHRYSAPIAKERVQVYLVDVFRRKE